MEHFEYCDVRYYLIIVVLHKLRKVYMYMYIIKYVKILAQSHMAWRKELNWFLNSNYYVCVVFYLMYIGLYLLKFCKYKQK